jgi:hypothetical protein
MGVIAFNKINAKIALVVGSEIVLKMSLSILQWFIYQHDDATVKVI